VEKTSWPGVFRSGRDLYTANATPGHRVYGEDLRVEGGTEYRRWDPFRSKLAALLLKGAPPNLLNDVESILYLGGAHGTTVSHLSDALPDARIFVIEKSPTSFAPLLALSRRRTNLYPILSDAQLPERYGADVGLVDLLYQDVAQRAQPEIFLENAHACLETKGRGVLMLKVRSVTQRKPPAVISREASSTLTRSKVRIERSAELIPFTRDHVAFVTQS
jgi:fibrillarin-like pre-rRNA processing protein